MGKVQLNDKVKLLKNASLFSKLRKQDLEVVAESSEYRHFKDGDIIFREGSHEEGLFIIKDGEVSITKYVNDEKRINLARFIPGECFGEMDLLKNAPRNATAVAETDTSLLVFPMKGTQFRDVLEKYPEISARILYKLLAIVAGRIRSTNRLISEKSPWIRDLRRQLFSDQLTGLYNRSFLDEEFAALLPGYGESTSLLMLKPDDFKEINDRYGHAAGDKILRMMAIFILSILRDDDIGIRYKGNEFAAVLPDTKTEEAVILAEELKSTLNEMDISHIINSQNLNITVSIGIATYPTHADNSRELINKAYEKMFKARNSGGNIILTL